MLECTGPSDRSGEFQPDAHELWNVRFGDDGGGRSIQRICAAVCRLERGAPPRMSSRASRIKRRCGPEARAPTLWDTCKLILHPQNERTLRAAAHGRFRRAPKTLKCAAAIGGVCSWGVKPRSAEQQEALPVEPAKWVLELSPAAHDPSMEGKCRKRGDHEQTIAHGF